MRRTIGSARGDARGEAPCMKITLISPFPGGEERSASAGGGMGAAKQAKGKVGRRQRRQTTLWVPPTPAAPATCRASHPLGTANARRSDDLPGKPPAEYHSGRDSQCRRGTPPAAHHSGRNSRQAKGRPARHPSAARGASGKEARNLPNYLLSFLITRLS